MSSEKSFRDALNAIASNPRERGKARQMFQELDEIQRAIRNQATSLPPEKVMVAGFWVWSARKVERHGPGYETPEEEKLLELLQGIITSIEEDDPSRLALVKALQPLVPSGWEGDLIYAEIVGMEPNPKGREAARELEFLFWQLGQAMEREIAEDLSAPQREKQN
jgi:hypothetical protein